MVSPNMVLSRNHNNNVVLWIIWGIFSGLVVFLASFHEPWVDEYYVYFMCKSYNLRELWAAMTREGHFMLWHLLVFPFAKLGCSYWCLQLVSIILVSVAGWILLMKAPFDIFSKCLILFSYPIVYEFPVISRCYALIPLCLFLIASYYKKQKEHPFVYCIFVGILSHTHAYMEGLVAALFLLFCYENILCPIKKGRPVEKKYITAASIIVGFVLLAGMQVIGSLKYAHEVFVGSTDSWADLWRKLMVYTYSFPIKFLAPVLGSGISKYLNTIGVIVSAIMWGGVILLLYLLFWNNKNNRKFIIVGIIAIGWQIFMALNVFLFANQRVFLPMLIIIFLAWCGYSKELKIPSLLLVLSLFMLTGRYGEIARDIKEIHSSELPMHDYIISTIPNNNQLCFLSDAEMNRQVYAFSYDVLRVMYPQYDIILSSEDGPTEIPTSLIMDEDKDYYIITAAPLTEAPGYRIREIGYFPAGYHQHFPFEHIYCIRKSIIDQNI